MVLRCLWSFFKVNEWSNILGKPNFCILMFYPEQLTKFRWPCTQILSMILEIHIHKVLTIKDLDTKQYRQSIVTLYHCISSRTCKKKKSFWLTYLVIKFFLPPHDTDLVFIYVKLKKFNIFIDSVTLILKTNYWTDLFQWSDPPGSLSEWN